LGCDPAEVALALGEVQRLEVATLIRFDQRLILPVWSRQATNA
jgi:hypothetical protein